MSPRDEPGGLDISGYWAARLRVACEDRGAASATQGGKRSKNSFSGTFRRWPNSLSTITRA